MASVPGGWSAGFVPLLLIAAAACGGTEVSGEAGGGSSAATGGGDGTAGVTTPTRGDGTSPALGGCPVFPADNPWNTDVSDYPLQQVGS